MAWQRWRNVRRWVRRRRTALVIGGVAVVLVAFAAYLIYDTATEPIVGETDTDASDPFSAPSSLPALPAPPALPDPGLDTGAGLPNLDALDPADFGLSNGGLSIGCDFVSFTMTFTSDVPVAVAGYLSSGGENGYFPKETSGSVTFEQCDTRPSVLIVAQAGSRARSITCTATKSGGVVETRTAGGPNGIVYCYA